MLLVTKSVRIIFLNQIVCLLKTLTINIHHWESATHTSVPSHAYNSISITYTSEKRDIVGIN